MVLFLFFFKYTVQYISSVAGRDSLMNDAAKSGWHGRSASVVSACRSDALFFPSGF